MSKAIIRIDIPTDYADEYKQWIIDGSLCYLEDGAWTFLKEVEYKVEPYREAIPIEWMKSWAMKNWVKTKKCEFDIIVSKLIDDWMEEENETN